MANFYYELADCVVPYWGSKYKVVYSQSGDAMMAGGYKLTRHSNRVWCEQNNVVWFIKNIEKQPYDALVDLKEFMWVKLKAETISG